MERFLLGIYTMVPPAVVTNRHAADTGLDAPPDPPLTDAEFERVLFGAKSALLGVLRQRAEERREAERATREAKGGKFTEPQTRELLALLQEGPQKTYGKATTRVQNILKSRGLVRFTALITAPHTDRCELTPEGREVATRLYEERNRKSRAKEKKRLASTTKGGARG